MFRLVLRSLAILATAGLMTACSSMPEWTKPSTWYDGVTETKKAEEAKPAADSAKTEVASTPANGVLPPVDDPLAPEQPAGPRIKTANTPTEFPNLSTQTEPREASTTESQRREIRDSLVADRDKAQHTADELRGGTTPAAAPPAAAKPAAQPAPAADGEKKDEEKPSE
jgi:hypothetical protein